MELLTRDTTAAEGFYTAVFGWKSQCEVVKGTPYAMFQIDETDVAGMMMMPDEVPIGAPSHWSVYFAVDDCADVEQRTVDLGGAPCCSRRWMSESADSPFFPTPTGRSSTSSSSPRTERVYRPYLLIPTGGKLSARQGWEAAGPLRTPPARGPRAHDREDAAMYEFVCDKVIPGCTHKDLPCDTPEASRVQATQHLHEHHGMDYLDVGAKAKLGLAILRVPR